MNLYQALLCTSPFPQQNCLHQFNQGLQEMMQFHTVSTTALCQADPVIRDLETSVIDANNCFFWQLCCLLFKNLYTYLPALWCLYFQAFCFFIHFSFYRCCLIRPREPSPSSSQTCSHSMHSNAHTHT